MSSSDKPDRDAILARRRLFVASAMASIAVTQTRCDNPFRPCLEPPIQADAEPLVCLSAPPQRLDGAVSITTDAGTTADASGEPQPCLSVALPRDAGMEAAPRPPPVRPPPQPPRPQPCLKPSNVDPFPK